MTISFSGLASGLDTSQWIESLVALKRAKVNTLQTQKEEIVAQKDTLSAIKSFFASFRATVQKITDSKFGNTSMDLFASNIATSSNLNILSATVNQSAMEGIYKVKVDSLATKTTATSGFKDKVTTDSLATMSTKLTALGMSTGKVQIKKDDVTRSFQIESKDTIESLIGKFDQVGVKANYNTNTGIFSVDIGIENITDVGNTNIINALGLVNANQGYSSEKIEFYETVKVTATGSTLLKDIDGIDINGSDDSGGEIVVSNNLGEITTISVNETTTIDNLCQAFAYHTIGINFLEGKIYIEESNILSENIGLIDALQVEETDGGASTEVTTKELYVRKRADLNTTFGDLGLTSNAELILRSGSSTTKTITINPTMSINSLFNSLESVTIGSNTYNIEGIIEDGIISLNTGVTTIGFEGEVAELLGINNGTWKTIGIENTSASMVTYTKTATESTTLAELGYNGTYEVEIRGVMYAPDRTSFTAKSYATITVDGTTTLDSLFNKLDDYGIEASISNGKISIEEQVGATVLVANTGSGLLKSLGITGTSTAAGTYTTVGTTLTSTTGVTVTLSGTAYTTEDCLLSSKYSVGTTIKYKLNYNLENMANFVTFTVTATSTFGDLAEDIGTHVRSGHTCVFRNGTFAFTLDGSTGQVGSVSGYTLKAMSGQSYSDIFESTHYGGKKLLDYGTTFAELGQTANITLDVYTTSGVQNVIINEDDTVGEALTKLGTYGITSSISDNGKLTISGSDNAYIMSDDEYNDILFNAYFALGSSTHYKTIPNVEFTYTDSNPLNVTKTLSGATTLGDLGINNNQTITVKKSGTTETLTFTKARDLDYVISQLSQKGITAKIQDGKFVIEASDDAYISGISTTLKSKLGLSNDFANKVIRSSKEYYLDHAEGYDLFNNLYTEDNAQIYDVSSFLGKKIMVYNGGNSTFEEIQFTSIPSLNDFCQSLEAYGIQTNLNADGSIKFSSNVGSYLTTDGIETNQQSNILEKLGINNWLPLYEYQPNDELIQANQTNTLYATGTTFLNEIDSTFIEATVSGTIDGNDFGIVIKNSDSIDDILGKFNSLGISAIVNESGEITISDGEKHLEINDFGGIDSLLGLQVADNLGGYLESQNPLMEKTTTIKDISAFSYANSKTTMKDLGISDGMLTFYLDGEKHEFQIDAEYNIKDLNIQLNEELGDYLCSSVMLEFDENGYLNITSDKYNDIKVGAIGDTSNFVSVMRLENNEDGTVKSTKQFYNGDENSLLIKEGLFKYGALETGKFTIGGEEFEITNETTLAGLIGEINSSEAANATAYWDANNAKLVIESRTSGSGYINIDRGTSNFTDLLGFTETSSSGTSIQLGGAGINTYVNAIFTTFKLGGHTITIDNETTLKDVIDQINATGLIQASWNDTNKYIEYEVSRPVEISATDGTIKKLFKEMNVKHHNGLDYLTGTQNNTPSYNFDAQQKGKMAELWINGTYYTSTLNTIDSSVHHIDGVTINLKGISSDGGETTLTIERDKETLANAVSNLVDSYNTLIENIDKEISANSALANQTGLKMLKNQIRSLMTSSFIGGGSYNTLSQIGISTKTATAGDITTNGIDKLSFDKEKFIKAYNADSEGVKKLLLGTDDDKGVFWQLESIVDNAVSSTTGFFSTATNSYNKQVTRINDRITKTQKEVDTYKARLERKFSAMELLITQLQNQYSSFLGAGIQ